MPKGSLNVSLKGADDIFSTEESRQEQQREQVQQIPIGELFPFKNHPFKVLDDESMQRTVESVEQYGVLSPLIARPRPEGGYEIISGHRRQHAAQLAGLETLPVMSFNNGNERRKLNAKWEHLRVQYREAGMSEDAIQAMYEFDLGVLNSERAYITNTMTVSGAADDCAAKETSDFKQYEKAVTVTDTYHETKSRFAWIGEIENEQLLTALETLKVEDLEIITMYAYEGYDITEISKVYGVSRPTISIKIKRITKFLKNFNFNATN